MRDGERRGKRVQAPSTASRTVARVLFSGSDACADSGTWTNIDSFNFHALRAYKEARTGGRDRTGHEGMERKKENRKEGINGFFEKDGF